MLHLCVCFFFLFFFYFFKGIASGKLNFQYDPKIITGSLLGDQYKFFIITHSVLRMKNVSYKSRRENQNTVLYSITFLCKSCHLRIGGLGVACWPLVPKFAGSNPAEAVGFLGRKNPQHTFLRRGSKAAGSMS